MHPRLKKILRRRHIDAREFDLACKKALGIVGQEKISERMRIAAALAVSPGKRLCDVGGGVSLYPLVAQILGADVTVIDLLPDYETNAVLKKKVDTLAQAGIRFIRGDIADPNVAPGNIDTVTAYETIEHFPHSPKPALTKLVSALVPGGRLCLSVPNIARFEMRLRALKGRTPHEGIDGFFHNGSPFLGHHREYTRGEVAFLANALGLEILQIFGMNITYESVKKKSVVQRALISLEENWAIGDHIMPDTLRHHIWLEARKAGAS